MSACSIAGPSVDTALGQPLQQGRWIVDAMLLLDFEFMAKTVHRGDVGYSWR